MKLRPYQEEIIGKIRTEFAKGNNRIILQLATGGGKTVIFTYIAKSAVEKGSRVLVITDRKELLKQAGSTFEKFGIKSNFLTAKTKKIESHNLFVAMSETIKRRIAKPDYVNFILSFDIIIIDEAHKGNFDKLFETISPLQYIIGATATPYRKRGGKVKELKLYYDSIVNGPEITDLIKLGYLSKAKSYGIPIDFSKVKLKGGEFDPKAIEKKYEENKVYEGVIENYKRICPDSKALLFAASVKSSIHICEILNNEGIKAKHIDANSKDRNEILEDFKDGKFNILCNVGILTTGYDCPSIESIILYRATMSLPLFLQMSGRGSRIFENKDHFNILDFGGNIDRHSFWQSSRVWSLDFASKPKKKGEAPLKNCRGCGAFIAANAQKCSFCGYEYPKPKVKESNLKVNLELLSPSQIQKYARNKATFDELVEIQREKGYSKLWIARNVKSYEELKRFAQWLSPQKAKGWLYYNKSRYGY